MKMFQLLHPFGKGVGGIAGQYRAMRLKNGGAMVIQLIYIMYSDTAFLFSVADHGFMHMTAIHTLAAIVGQKGRVDIDDAVRVGPDQGRGIFQRKPASTIRLISFSFSSGI